MLIPLQISVKPHVKKFLLSKYGEQYKLCLRDHLGVTIYNMLRTPRAKAREIERVKLYSETYIVTISDHFISDFACKNLDEATLVQFNALVEDMLMTCFHEFVENMESIGMEQRMAIAHFMTKYSFDETDVKYDTLKKSYQRYRKRQLEAGRSRPEATVMVPFVLTLQLLSAKSSRKMLLR